MFGNEFTLENCKDIGNNSLLNSAKILFASKISCTSEICPQPEEPASVITTGFHAIEGSKFNLIFRIFFAISFGKSKQIKVDF